MPKPFVDYLPDWVQSIDLTKLENYKYAFAVQTFEKLQQVRAQFPQARDFGQWVVEDKLKCEAPRYFPCWRNSEFPRWTPDIDELFPRACERIDFDPVVMNGLTYWKFRFSIGVGVLTPYAPESPATLEVRANVRAERARQAELDSMPLFQIDIRAEQEKERR